ncbi:hypothetical protein CPB83DRAFT_888971 [Crepidotus variabilis]|uniref:Uncharacterized protein n=1 Tax=Crepidotus variabilis TaxID=179855 RepID=A0A9P6JWU7_9AGAR|nr:hypothetical protein CPB83DRAFT_888971 [Crepidotus variabilis]
MPRLSRLLAATTLLASGTLVHSHPASQEVARQLPATGPNYRFSFGDSYSETRFNPNGTLPNPANPLGNPDAPPSGPNWVTYGTTKYNHSVVYTYNYASNGATIDDDLVEPSDPSSRTLTDQVNDFLAGAGKKPSATPWTSENSLFSIWIGMFDIEYTYFLSGNRDLFSDQLLDAEFPLVKKLYDAGARNFLFNNVAPINRTPRMLRQPSSAQAKQAEVIDGFNARLSSWIRDFGSKHTDAKIFFFDANARFTSILNNPKTYGFKDAKSYGSGDDFFWMNDFQPGSRANDYIAQVVGKDVLGNTVW